MDIQINTANNIAGREALTRQLEETVRSRLSRFSERLTRVEVHVGDENGDRNAGDDKRCVIEVRPAGRAPAQSRRRFQRDPERRNAVVAIPARRSRDQRSDQRRRNQEPDGTGVARHTFCSRCGIHPFYVPRSHPDGLDVNVRALDNDCVAPRARL